MTLFAALALLLVVATMTLLLLPLRRRNATTAASRRQLNIVIYRDQLAELESDRKDGALSDADYEQSRRELQKRIIEDTEEDGVASVATAPRKTMTILAVALPLAAVGLYLLLGTPEGINPPPAQPRFTAEDIDRMVAGLAARLEKEPDNLKGWTMLARSYKALGRFDEAVTAFERAGNLVEADPNLLADHADALAAKQKGFDAKAVALLDKALKLDPDSLQALWLRGTAAFEADAYARALVDWERLLQLLPAESEDATALRRGIAEARERMQSAGARK